MSTALPSITTPANPGIQSGMLAHVHGSDKESRPAATTFAASTMFSLSTKEAVYCESLTDLKMGEDVATAQLIHRLAPRRDVSDVGARGDAIARAFNGSHLGVTALNVRAQYPLLVDTSRANAPEYQQLVDASVHNKYKAHASKNSAFFPLYYFFGAVAAASAMYNHVLTPSEAADMFGLAPTDMRLMVTGKDNAPQDGNASVYITQDFKAMSDSYVVYWIYVATNAMGGVPLVDSTLLDGQGNSLVLPATHRASSFYRALATIRTIAELNDDELGFATAYAIGASRVISVIGETHEGGWFRDFMRCGFFGNPRGVLTLRDASRPAMPEQLELLRADVYGRVLRLAAAWSAADPTVDYAGKARLPTLVVNEGAVDSFIIPDDTGVAIPAHYYNTKDGRAAVEAFCDVVYSCHTTLTQFAAPGTAMTPVTITIRDATVGAVITACDAVLQGAFPNATLANATIAQIRDLVSAASLSANASAFNHLFLELWPLSGNPNVAAHTAESILGEAKSVFSPDYFLQIASMSLNQQGGINNFIKIMAAIYGGHDTANTIRDVLSGMLLVYTNRVNAGFYSTSRAPFGYRHYSHPVVQLYSWIEPHSLVPLGSQVPAVQYLSASYADIGTQATYPAFSGEFLATPYAGNVLFAVSQPHNMRNVHFFNFYRNHTRDGLALMALTRDVDGTPLTTAYDAGNNTAAEGSHSPLSRMTWSLGDQPFPHYSEFFTTSAVTEYSYLSHRRRGDSPFAKPERNHMYLPMSDAATGNRPVTSAPEVHYRPSLFRTVYVGKYSGLARRAWLSKSKYSRLRAMMYHGINGYADPLTGVAHFSNYTFASGMHQYEFVRSYNHQLRAARGRIDPVVDGVASTSTMADGHGQADDPGDGDPNSVPQPPLPAEPTAADLRSVPSGGAKAAGDQDVVASNNVFPALSIAGVRSPQGASHSHATPSGGVQLQLGAPLVTTHQQSTTPSTPTTSQSGSDSPGQSDGTGPTSQ